jgi:hypothetical protein
MKRQKEKKKKKKRKKAAGQELFLGRARQEADHAREPRSLGWADWRCARPAC